MCVGQIILSLGGDCACVKLTYIKEALKRVLNLKTCSKKKTLKPVPLLIMKDLMCFLKSVLAHSVLQ